ncbi:betaine-aldehyde dehydrogenase [Meredithblackwellia eburnea MCA 4105]
MSTNYETRLFLNGSFVDSDKKSTFAVRSAATGELVAHVQEASKSDVDKAVAFAEASQPLWEETPPVERANCLRKLADLIETHSATIKKLDSICMGRPVGQQFIDVAMSCRRLRWDASLAESLHGESTTAHPGMLGLTLRVPFGVTAGILPFNIPLMMWVSKVGPSVAAGNAIIVKSSEKCPLAALFLGQLTVEAGFPPGIIQVISGGLETGKYLSEHMRIRKISFTGSTNAGKAIAAAAALSNLKDVTMELGGKSPTIIFEDADLDAAVPATAFSIQWNSGQVCVANSRLYVHEKIFAEFITRFKAAYESYKLGDPLDESTTLGPVADSSQGKRVMSYIAVGEKDGKKIVGGGRVGTGEGYFIQPTAFIDIPDDSRINREEVFGPVVVIHKFKDEVDVVRKANDTEMGLMAAVYTRDIDRAVRVARKLDAGTVAVNGTSPQSTIVENPFGGTKQSGIGRETGIETVKRWTEEKAVVINYKRETHL